MWRREWKGPAPTRCQLVLPPAINGPSPRCTTALAERLYRAAVGMLGRREDAEDTVQEVFMAVLKAQPRLTESQDLTAYLFTALRRAAGRCAARRARGPVLPKRRSTRRQLRPAKAMIAPARTAERLQRALLALPAEQREVIALKIDGELTFAQIAQVMGVSINTAASRYRYALEKLRASLSWQVPCSRRERVNRLVPSPAGSRVRVRASR